MSESKFPTLWVCMSSDLYPIYAVRHPRENLVEYVPAADRDSLRLALHHLCNAVYRYRVPDNINDADLIALAEKLAKELNRDESGNDC